MCVIQIRLEVGLGLGQKFANCAYTISKLRSTFSKLHRLTNHAQHYYSKDTPIIQVQIYQNSNLPKV